MKLTLKRKLVGANFIAIVLTAMLLTTLSSNKITTLTDDSLSLRTQAISEAATQGIYDWIDIRKDIASSVTPFVTENNIEPFLKQARLAASFDDIFFGTPYGGMYRSLPERNQVGYDPRSRGWYKEAVAARKQIITSAYRDAVTNELLITIAEPVSINGQFVGVIGADVLLDELVSDVINLNVGHLGNTMLIDTSENIFLAHSNPALMLNSVIDALPQLTTAEMSLAAERHSSMELKSQGVDKIYFFQRIPDTQWMFAIELDKQTEMAVGHSLLQESLILTIAIVVLVSIVLSLSVATLFKPLLRVTQAMANIAQGGGDLTQRIAVNGNDEVDTLAGHFNQFLDNMGNTVNILRGVAQDLNQQATVVAQGAEQRTTRVALQQDEITMVATAVEQMAGATREIAGTAEHTASNTEESVLVCQSGSQQVQKTQTSISKLAEEVQTATIVIQELEKHGHSINGILSTIQGIAEQTNLLALNAAIEAARAGSQGRGFAVVADEVRVLSQRTHASTQEIQQMIDVLHTTTARAVGIMNHSEQLASTSVDDANSAAASLETIQAAILQISDMSSQIASAAEEQASVTVEITRNTSGIRDVSNQLSNDSNTEAEQAQQLLQVAEQLNTQISRFKV
ncbi:methyl-accepting chemotaxis protein [Vibrio sp. FNV 38]|nr:methyl-accepting chemotaxis protein [Vibrio sp. FNV 38]